MRCAREVSFLSLFLRERERDGNRNDGLQFGRSTVISVIEVATFCISFFSISTAHARAFERTGARLVPSCVLFKLKIFVEGYIESFENNELNIILSARSY